MTKGIAAGILRRTSGWLRGHERHHHGRRATGLLLVIAVASGLPPSARAGAFLEPWQRSELAASGRVEAAVVDALAEGPAARVLVSLRVSGREGGGSLRRFTSTAARQSLRATADALLARVAEGELRLRRRFQSIDALAVEVDATALLEIAASPSVVGVTLDRAGQAGLLEAVPLSTVDRVRAERLKGKGVTVAVIDSGVDRGHRTFRKALAAERCFCSTGGGCCPNGETTQSGRGSAQDDHGHGTHVAGIIASRGRGAPRGVAPKSKVVAIKVLDEVASFCCSSDLVAALDWIITERPDVDVVNMSLGTFALFPGRCDRAAGPFATAIDTLRERGVLVFASSMNNASATHMAIPACVKHTVAVGATYDEEFGPSDWGICTDPQGDPNRVTCFSNTNGRTDLVAPGALITSAALGGGTAVSAGTSQASPMAAGCALLLRQAFPDARARQIERALKASEVVASDVKNGRGFPRLDCEAALADLRERLEGPPATP